MENQSRREFTTGLLHSLLTLSLVETLANARALGKHIVPIANRWLGEVEAISRAMKRRQAKQTEWQQKIGEIFQRVDLPDFLRAIDFHALSKKMTLPDEGEGAISIDPPRRAGLPKELGFLMFIYGMKQGRAIVPHCHRNMTSMHMLIGGQLHAWHFDRVQDEAQHLIVKPTLDRALTSGEASTISDDKDNVHWYKATSEAAFTFNVGVYEIDPTLKFSGRQFYLDPARGEKLGDGTMRVRHLTAREAYNLYGKS